MDLDGFPDKAFRSAEPNATSLATFPAFSAALRVGYSAADADEGHTEIGPAPRIVSWSSRAAAPEFWKGRTRS